MHLKSLSSENFENVVKNEIKFYLFDENSTINAQYKSHCDDIVLDRLSFTYFLGRNL